MKLHRPIVFGVVHALQDTFEKGYHADKVVSYWLKKQKKWGGRDRRFFSESVYEIVRWWRKLWYLYNQEVSLDEKHLLNIFGIWFRLNYKELPEWDEFSSIRSVDLNKKSTSFAVEQSVPNWLNDLGKKELGDSWASVLEGLNRPASVVLRTNQLLTTKEELQKRLASEGITTFFHNELPDGLILSERKNVFRTQSFLEGMFEVQDGSSQQVVPLLDLEPGLRVVDACAGAGGKSLHIASLMKNKGKVISLDIHERKLTELKRRARRAKSSIIETRCIETSKVIKRLHQSADRLLLDVPCSGLGVLRRNPDTKWKVTPERISELEHIQKQIIEDYSKIVRPGGKMVYATCSILPQENERIVSFFLENHGERWKLLKQKTLFPHECGFDGFFMAVLERCGDG